jgi:branched-chain amino acid transport system permease protein
MIVFQWYEFTGGDDGIHGIPRPVWLDSLTFYLICLAIFVVCFLLMRMIVNSSFGLTIRTMRENLERAKFIGINVRRYQLYNFILAGAFAGLAGGLLTIYNKFAQTESLHWSKSADPIFASLVGGMYSLVGPAVGAAFLKFLHIFLQQLHKGLLEYWELILGIILIVMVLFAPGGLVGWYQKIMGKAETS